MRSFNNSFCGEGKNDPMPEFYVPSGKWVMYEGVLGDEIKEMRLKAIVLLDDHR